MTKTLENSATKGNVISYVDLKTIAGFVGKTVSTSGKVYGSKDIRSMVLVNLGGSYPNQLLTLALKGKAKDPGAQLAGKTITVTGEVIDYQRKPEIIVTAPCQYQIRMNEPFLIPVTYQGSEREFKARFERWGYTQRIAVLIEETTVIFEPDEEGGYRALSFDKQAELPRELLHALSIKLAKLID